MKKTRKPTFLEILLSVLLLCFLAYNGIGYILSLDQMQAKQRDAIRISDTDQIVNALALYYTDHHNTYPSCLYAGTGCTSTLAGSSEMPTVPKDPVTGIGYAYAAYGTGSTCTGYHVGSSLERTGSQALLTGSDAPNEPSSALCTGSAPDFSGLSYVKGGQPCDTLAGTPQPTDAANGETCYDLARHRPTTTK